MSFTLDDGPTTNTLGALLVDAFAEFWEQGAGPNHSAIDRKITAAGLAQPEGMTKEQKIIDAFTRANDKQAERLMRGLLEALRKHAMGRYSEGPIGEGTAWNSLREAIESAGFALDENFKLSAFPAITPSPATDQAPKSSPNTREALVPAKLERGERKPNEVPREIFLVHGHNEALKYEVAHWIIEHAEVKPIILSQQLNSGLTLIEKFESYSADAACAVVLMTPDDIAHAKRTPGVSEERARQNVVFELGYFCGKLRRQNVIVMNFGVELPGDIKGLVYIGKDQWELSLGKELAKLGFTVKF
ncbi:TIR domain-containing protein [Arthrobacter woluwensis]|uniref:Predicted nucleotide-binding protein containing TIR-like domain-containing protein n=1 Tax=Arthrobacter woluwensis TaxID=156980 RepID=A0A1H4I6G1_9MICC|nr:nucleotide-binding protein [Arthrobacter woluwensis]SEB29684.1 Predicted nucleotide-binding protein containing TIR-like domain-containing protein [Arthrobacter woluwensis]